MTLTLLDPEPDEPDDGRLAVPDGFPMAPAQAVYHGLAGEIVQTIAPHTEADPVAILAQLLVAFGAARRRRGVTPVRGMVAAAATAARASPSGSNTERDHEGTTVGQADV